MEQAKEEILRHLRQEIQSLQGELHAGSEFPRDLGLSSIQHVFPDNKFPTGVIHEVLGGEGRLAAATGFVCSLLAKLMEGGRPVFWVGTQRTLYPAGLTQYGIAPHHIVFVAPRDIKLALWAMEEILHCGQVAAVVGQIPQLTFVQSRRLQLAAQQSKITGFILRKQAKGQQQNACAARWRVTAKPSSIEDALPGIGFAEWQLELLKMRGGATGQWHMRWEPSGLVNLEQHPAPMTISPLKKIG